MVGRTFGCTYKNKSTRDECLSYFNLFFIFHFSFFTFHSSFFISLGVSSSSSSFSPLRFAIYMPAFWKAFLRA